MDGGDAVLVVGLLVLAVRCSLLAVRCSLLLVETRSSKENNQEDHEPCRLSMVSLVVVCRQTVHDCSSLGYTVRPKNRPEKKIGEAFGHLDT